MKEEQLREDQRREALARRDEPHAEETLPPPAAPEPQHEAPRAEEPMRTMEPERAQEPVRASPPERAEAPQPKIDSKALLESAGLVMVETDHNKAPAAPAAEEPQHLGRPRRERPKQQTQDDELQQVETKR
jgi:hypothetical protein